MEPRPSYPSYYLDKRLKEIEDEQQTHERRLAFADSRRCERALNRYRKAEETKLSSRPFLEFLKAVGVIY